MMLPVTEKKESPANMLASSRKQVRTTHLSNPISEGLVLVPPRGRRMRYGA